MELPTAAMRISDGCLTCLDPVWGGEWIAAHLLEVSEKAREMEHKSSGYAEITARNAEEWVQRRQRGRA